MHEHPKMSRKELRGKSWKKLRGQFWKVIRRNPGTIRGITDESLKEIFKEKNHVQWAKKNPGDPVQGVPRTKFYEFQ